MGWYGGYNSRQEIIDEITEGYVNPHDPTQRVVYLKHCLRGNVLWGVCERKTSDGVKRWITCDLLYYYRGDKTWSYKPLDESMHPYYYTCPLSYLDMVPVECEEWREGVREYHAKQREKRAARKARKKKLTTTNNALH